MKCQKLPPAIFFNQKRPPLSGGMSGQLTRGTCLLGQSRQARTEPASCMASVSVTLRHRPWARRPARHACPCATSACRVSPRRQGPWPMMEGDINGGQATCWLCLMRQVLASSGPGNMCHVSFGQTCRHREVVFFDKNFVGSLFWHFIGASGLFIKNSKICRVLIPLTTWRWHQGIQFRQNFDRISGNLRFST
jgi:hypothetical protein